jgi:hypothetical protein
VKDDDMTTQKEKKKNECSLQNNCWRLKEKHDKEIIIRKIK